MQTKGNKLLVFVDKLDFDMISIVSRGTVFGDCPHAAILKKTRHNMHTKSKILIFLLQAMEQLISFFASKYTSCEVN